MQKKYLLLFLVFLLAGFVRLWGLGSIPHGLTWDEAAIGYNGHAVVTTRRDEWLERLPISFRSFGDYKAPLAIYLNGLFTVVLGLTPLIVRLPFALAGIFSCVGIYFLIRELALFYQIKNKETLATLGALSLAISPWHIHFSRIGFEAGLSLFFCIVGLTALFHMLNSQRTLKWLTASAFSLISGLSFVASLYAYHSAKIYVPILLITLLLFFVRKQCVLFCRTHIIEVLIAVAAVAGALYPLIADTLWGNGATRAGVLVFSMGYSPFVLVQTIISQFLAHFSFTFLFGGDVANYRHTVGTGIIYPLTAVVLCAAVVLLLKKKVTQPLRNLFTLGLALVCIGILPAALSQEAPHQNRALLTLIGSSILEATSLQILFTYIKDEVYKKMVVGTLICIYVLFFVTFINTYMTTFAARSAAAFQDGYVEAFTLATDYEKGLNGKPKVNTILFSNEYGQPYIFALFVRKTNPIWYRGGSLNSYLFVDSIAPSDLERDNTLLVATPKDEIKDAKPDAIIYGSDHSVRFLLYYTGLK